MTDSPGPIDFVARWRAIVAARREQHDAACAQERRTTDDYWARRAAGYHKFARDSARENDPVVAVLRQHLRPSDTLLDVGAGTGRHALPLAHVARQVVALDPSAAMLSFLRDDAEALGLRNVNVIEGAWPDAAARMPAVDVALSAHVLYPIEDVVPFLRALDRVAGRLCFLHLMGRQPWFDELGLWEALHGQPRQPQPTHIDALNVLHQLGCLANVEIAWLNITRSFENLEDACDHTAETVAIGDNPESLTRLREVLSRRLTPVDGGRFALPFGPYPLATVWWEAGALQ